MKSLYCELLNVSTLQLIGPDAALLSRKTFEPKFIKNLIADLEQELRQPIPNLREVGSKLYTLLDDLQPGWLAQTWREGLILRLGGDRSFQHLPWELLYAEGEFLCTSQLHHFSPVRVGKRVKNQNSPANRPLRVLFMACSAEGVEPLLDFEAEESNILEVTRHHEIELVVEESGSLEGLEQCLQRYAPQYFDIVHLSGHADLEENYLFSEDRPYFIVEDEFGQRREADARDFAAVFSNGWPKLLFLSGCRTAEVGKAGFMPSLCEALQDLGAPFVLGWALPVGDRAANICAASLYERLAAGATVEEAIATARAKLASARSDHWFFLRMYTGVMDMQSLVTTPGTQNRASSSKRTMHPRFFDTSGKIQVCPAKAFVGRRRYIQRLLKRLRGSDFAGALIHGMGGLGKSSLAARICDRLTDYYSLVWVGSINLTTFLAEMVENLGSSEVAQLFYQTELPLAKCLEYLFQKLPSDRPLLLVFDNFEDNIHFPDESSQVGELNGRFELHREAREILIDLLKAIQASESKSRVLITCRYRFALGELQPLLYEESLGSFSGAELSKKLAFLPIFSPDSVVNRTLRDKILRLSAGNPRLLERLAALPELGFAETTQMLERLQNVASDFREETLLGMLLERLTPHGRLLLAHWLVCELPVNRSALAAIADPLPIEPDLDQALSLGLVEGSFQRKRYPAKEQEPHYLVSKLLEPLLKTELGQINLTKVARKAAVFLFESQGWFFQEQWHLEGHPPNIDRAYEIFRLAFLGKKEDLATTVANVVAKDWFKQSRFREIEQLCLDLLHRGQKDYRLFLQLGKAKQATGKIDRAIQYYEQALAACPEASSGFRPLVLTKERGTILMNLAMCYRDRGDFDQALALWHQSNEVLETIGDVQLQGHNYLRMAPALAARGQLSEASELLNRAMYIMNLFGDESGRAQVLSAQSELAKLQGNEELAFELCSQALESFQRIGDDYSIAACQDVMAEYLCGQGAHDEALDLWTQALSYFEYQEQYSRQAMIKSKIADIFAKRGEYSLAEELFEEALEHHQSVDDWQGKAVTLSYFASALADKGEYEKALVLLGESVALHEQLQDKKGLADRLSVMGNILLEKGDFNQAMSCLSRSLTYYETLGNYIEQAKVLNNLGTTAFKLEDDPSPWLYLEQAIAIYERLSNEQEKINVLFSMFNMASFKEDRDRQKEVAKRIVRPFIEHRDWTNLAEVLLSLGQSKTSQALDYLFQSLWLTLETDCAADLSLEIAAVTLETVGAQHELAPLIAAYGFWIEKSTKTDQLGEAQLEEGQNPDESEASYSLGEEMLVFCAMERNIPPDEQFVNWLKQPQLVDPNLFLPALKEGIAAALPQERWLFDPTEIRNLRKNKIPLLQPLLSGFKWVIGQVFKRKSLTGDHN